MIIYAIDDEPLALSLLDKMVMKAAPNAAFRAFSEPEHFLKAARNQPCDVAFLDIEMGLTTGLELAQTLCKENIAANIIFVTAHEQYACDAYDIFASGYVLKPVTQETIAKQLANLRVPVRDEPHTIEIKTFGNFDVFVDGAPVHFSRKKSKELLAYLVDKRGTGTTSSELASALWSENKEGAKRSKYVNVLINSLRSDLEAVGAGKVIARCGRELSVNTHAFKCDLYDLLRGETAKQVRYAGHYMNRYSWAETTKAYLDINF